MRRVSRFEGSLDLQLLDSRSGRPETRGGRSLWKVLQPLAYTTLAGDRIEIPAGFLTDLASIPRIFWNLLPPDGPWAEAAVVHDALYFTEGGAHRWNGRRVITRKDSFGPAAFAWPYSRAESDGILLQAMTDLGVPWLQRLAIYAGVRVGGWIGWGA